MCSASDYELYTYIKKNLILIRTKVGSICYALYIIYNIDW